MKLERTMETRVIVIINEEELREPIYISYDENFVKSGNEMFHLVSMPHQNKYIYKVISQYNVRDYPELFELIECVDTIICTGINLIDEDNFNKLWEIALPLSY